MSKRYAKTLKGREEITSRTVPLPRPARNLLLIIDNTKPALQWATLIQGATETDVDSLFNNGLSRSPSGSRQPSANARRALGIET